MALSSAGETRYMDKRELGLTGIRVSALALGTVELGLDYGIRFPEEKHIGHDEAIRLLEYAADAGINLYDTAPAYGNSQQLLGQALGSRQDCYIATKVAVPQEERSYLYGKKLEVAVNTSLEQSLKALKRKWLDIVQIHNATAGVIGQGEMLEALLKARTKGMLRFIGATVYGEEDALAAIELGCFDVIQVAYNLFDQRPKENIFPATRCYGTGVIGRSALLKGVLSQRAEQLPPPLSPLREQAEEALKLVGGDWQALPQLALRFCLSSEDIDTVLIGASNIEELKAAIEAAEAGPLDAETLDKTQALAMNDERLLNPSNWPIL